MNDDPPTLHPSATELWQYAQAITTISALAARLRTRLAAAREGEGRLAFAEANNAALHHHARQHPALRLMTDAERSAWQHRVPAALAAAPGAEPVTVWTARLTDATSSPTGEWGVQAHTWRAGQVTASLFAVCRDAEDALAITRHLRRHGTPEHLTRLHQLATITTSQSTRQVQPTPTSTAGPTPSQDGGEPQVLSEANWEAALRHQLPTNLANKIIIKDPGHPHHKAWRELHQLANHHAADGADAAHLANLVHTVPAWRSDVRNPPALAHWALNHTPSANRDVGRPASRQQRRPGEALAWAEGIDPNDPEHQLRAKLEFGRWGADVDRSLATGFPTLTQSTRAAGRDTATNEPDPATLAQLAAEVGRLDPTKPIDRRAAHIMLGRVPAPIDRLLAEKFADDPQITTKIRSLYPHGLPETGTTAGNNHTRIDERHATAAGTVAEPQSFGQAGISPDPGPSASPTEISTALAGPQPPTARRADPHPPAAPQQRR